MLAYEITPYSREAHEGFLRVSWCKGAREVHDGEREAARQAARARGRENLIAIPIDPTPELVNERTWQVLDSHLRRPDVRCLVAHIPNDADSLLGWAAVDLSQRAVVWVFVRDLYGKVRRRGLGTSLLLDCGLDISEPTPCLYWSPAAAAIAARGGYRIFYQPRMATIRRAA